MSPDGQAKSALEGKAAIREHLGEDAIQLLCMENQLLAHAGMTSCKVVEISYFGDQISGISSVSLAIAATLLRASSSIPAIKGPL
jgi:hypothetical protein